MSNDDPTIGGLAADAIKDVRQLVRAEIALAKAELKGSVIAGGLGIVLVLIAAAFGLMTIILLSIAFAYLLTLTGLHAAWAFLIVAGAYVLIAALLIFVALLSLKKIRPPRRAIAAVGKLPQAFKRS